MQPKSEQQPIDKEDESIFTFDEPALQKKQPVKPKSESQVSNDKQKSELNTDEPIKPETITVQT